METKLLFIIQYYKKRFFFWIIHWIIQVWLNFSKGVATVKQKTRGTEDAFGHCLFHTQYAFVTLIFILPSLKTAWSSECRAVEVFFHMGIIVGFFTHNL